MKALCVGMAAGLLALSTAAAQDDVVIKEAMTGKQLESILAEAGLSPTMLSDRNSGNPVATGQTSGLVFVVRGLECDGFPKKCKQLLLFANFDLGREATDEDFRVVNQFNETSSRGRAYVLEDRRQIGVDFAIDLTGGVTDDHIDSRLGRWPEVIRTFRQEMIDAQTGS